MPFHDPYRPASAIGDGASAPKAEVPEDESTKVPTGTTKEILAWVGDDQERAEQALDAEEKHDTPRVGLVRELRKIAGADEDE